MNSSHLTNELKSNRIVCLDSLGQQGTLHLFAEVIETILISSRYWVRPLAIARSSSENFRLELLHDVRDAAQLILPIEFFRDALDTEILPLISELFHPEKDSAQLSNPQKVLYQFISNLYQSD